MSREDSRGGRGSRRLRHDKDDDYLRRWGERESALGPPFIDLRGMITKRHIWKPGTLGKRSY